MGTSEAEVLRFAGLGVIPARVRVRIEVARGSFVKRRPAGEIDLVSPLPCPFDYGSIVDTRAPDGDPLDAVVLGTRSGVGTCIEASVRAVLGFVDRGEFDPKVVCAAAPLGNRERQAVERFFHRYAWLKWTLHRLRRQGGPTFVVGWLARR